MSTETAIHRASSDSPDSVPLERSGYRWRLWLGGIGLLLLACIGIKGLADTHGALGMMAAFGALVLSPIPLAFFVSGLGLKHEFTPDLLYRMMPYAVLAFYLFLAVASL